jgi:hypothetical protein
MRCLLIVTLVSTLLLAVLSVPTNAATIYQDGNLVQSVDFEGDTVGEHPAYWRPKDGKLKSGNNVVSDAAVDPGPAHAGSTQYLLLDRHNNKDSDGRAYIDSWSAMSSGTAKVSLMLYVPSSNNPANGQFGFGSTLSDGFSVAVGREVRGAIEYMDGGAGAWATIGTTYSDNVWQQWDLEFDLDSGMASICVAGSCSSNLDTGRTGVTVSRLEIEAGWDRANPHSKLYVDDVGAAVIPEPCTIVLLSMVAAMGLGFRRR